MDVLITVCPVSLFVAVISTKVVFLDLSLEPLIVALVGGNDLLEKTKKSLFFCVSGGPFRFGVGLPPIEIESGTGFQA